jgi:hypothetical protein
VRHRANQSTMRLGQPKVCPTWQAAGFVNKIWRVTEPDAAPGSLYIFLADGSLVQTSCVEVYRLSAWRREATGALTITEDLSVRRGRGGTGW